ncbi:alpha/beta hydrolase [Streptomyces sp. 35G-GA-8]|uniref:alpha/beta hydrolase n=1 Tax=Streptomyces sp. 35G-GA-8 TaxID=2939434 RepID=UPI00201F386D|nr:alpha/beta hydrolase [Streptomyces sp. 35G-GA-8]MCL7375790.1 alpha/beta hydrolase [Streptomyces sp. 35G-GA-8]
MRAVAKYGALTTLGSVVLSALVVVPVDAADAGGAHPTISAARGVARAAERAATAGITFGACPEAERLPDPLVCGTVEVPLDYTEPDGRTIGLTVSRVPASGSPERRQGALVFNPGGPGASGMYFPMVAEVPHWKRIAEAYDLIGYAPRGVGRSAPLSCEDPADYIKAPTQSPVHPSASYKRERIAEAKAYAQGCARAAGPALRHYNSLNNARDLDVLRAALGEQKLSFMGASYGTYFGALYATLFPSHVGRMVLDSAVNPDPEQIWYRNNLDQSVAFERRWEDFRTWVAKHDATYHLGTDAEQVGQSYERVRAGVAHKPAGGKVGPGQLQAAMLGAGYYDDYWPTRATALSEYLKGNQQPLIAQASPRPAAAAESENAGAVYTAVECNDAPWPTDFAVWDRDNTALARRAPFETWDNAWMNLPCAYWTAPRGRPAEVRTSPGQLPPTLILAAERDAATPYEGALELHKRLAGSALVTERDAGTHGVTGGANACATAYLEDYLLHGKAPVRAADCAPRAEPDPTSPRPTDRLVELRRRLNPGIRL